MFSGAAESAEEPPSVASSGAICKLTDSGSRQSLSRAKLDRRDRTPGFRSRRISS
jgi:hypothetical protein